MTAPTVASPAPRTHRFRRVGGRLLMALLTAGLLGACASRPPAAPTQALLHDELFQPPSEKIDAAAVFTLSQPMRRFADSAIASKGWRSDQRRALLTALAADGQLRLNYSDERTRTAAEAYDKRAGNCLSLVIMTAAFAKYLDIPVRYQSVQVRPLYSRSEDLTLVSGHVNVLLSRRPVALVREGMPEEELLVDFVAPSALRGLHVQPISEATLLAMYMNNRAAESLAAGDNNDAYAWAREAMRQDPGYLTAVNTLALVYLRSGHLAHAESALRHVLVVEPEDQAALSNLVVTLRREGRATEATEVAKRLARLEPYPPFHFLDLGRQALQQGQLEQARDLIKRELRRQPYQHEVNYWAAVVDVQLGDTPAAEEHLRVAAENGDSPRQQARYNAKLAALRAPVAP